jgi:hypothetical protein
MKANIDNLLFSGKLNQQNCFMESSGNRLHWQQVRPPDKSTVIRVLD